MDAPRRPPLADPDFDPPPSRHVRLRDFNPAECQRLVVNPFLAAFAMVVWWEAVRRLLASPFAPAFVLMFLPLVFLPYLVQFHCLDCGRTGAFPRRDYHACPALLVRMAEGKRPRLPIPSARAQLFVWGYILGGATLLYSVAGVSSR